MKYTIQLLLLLLAFIQMAVFSSEGDTPSAGDDVLPGHKKPIGEQHESLGHIDVLTDFPSVEKFFEDYIKGSKPVVFKNAAVNMPAFKLWTDDYMKKSFGDITVDVEEGKKENRSLAMWKWKFREFLDKYKTSDVYMVNSLPKQMREDLRLLPVMSCGGYTKILTDVIMWFSSGGTKSVLHNDHIDNINCLFSGSKTLYMVHHKYKDFIKFDSAGGFSNVDVDAVDLKKYPGLAKAPWWKAEMHAGDCLFIPSKWFHQVRSFAEDKRNMAVNVWFYNMKQINMTDCKQKEKTGDDFLSLGQYPVLKEQKDQSGIRFLLSLDVYERPLSFKEMYKKFKEHSGEDYLDKRLIKKVLILLDKDENMLISSEDVNQLTVEELRFIAPLFPTLIMEEGDEEESEDDGEQNSYNTETKDEL